MPIKVCRAITRQYSHRRFPADIEVLSAGMGRFPVRYRPRRRTRRCEVPHELRKYPQRAVFAHTSFAISDFFVRRPIGAHGPHHRLERPRRRAQPAVGISARLNPRKHLRSKPFRIVGYHPMNRATKKKEATGIVSDQEVPRFLGFLRFSKSQLVNTQEAPAGAGAGCSYANSCGNCGESDKGLARLGDVMFLHGFLPSRDAF